MHSPFKITGIILAGGENKRMGRNKALVEWRGKSLLNWVFDAVTPLCTEIIVSSNEVIPVGSGVKIVPDRFKKIGPAAGIESGLFSSTTELNLVVSCDTPMISTGFFIYMLSKHQDKEISIPIHDGVNEPMIGVYNKSVQGVFEMAIKSGKNKPPAIIKSCRYQEVPIDESLNFYHRDLFLNLNSPEDLKK